MILRSVGVLSCGKVLGIMHALLGLLAGLFFAFLSMTGVAVNEQQADGNAMPFMAIGAGAIIFLPVVYGIAGFIGGMIAGAIYNLVAGIVGGLELEFEQPATTFPAP